MNKILVFACIVLSFTNAVCQPLSQKTKFTHQDTLRGSNGPDRSWWDVQRYDIAVTPDYVAQTISGTIDIGYKATGPGSVMQIDLQQPMEISGIWQDQKSLLFRREGNAFFVTLDKEAARDSRNTIHISFRGAPRIAKRPPWDGGWIFTKDDQGRPWMSVACQGLGASVWYPCKDYQGDEPDHGASLSITVPDTLVAVANGRLKERVPAGNGKTRYTWEVVNPINNYDIIPYIGTYVHWEETFPGAKGPLDCSYWVLENHLEKAKAQFQQVPQMLRCFEYWFGPYPFYEDGYKLVEAPHLGMEHQSAVAYGNKFMNGYLGRDLSGSGWGKKWDFIIVHESGHEWFGNNITTKDIADMWVHEGFTAYSETIFTTCMYGVAAGNEYVVGTRRNMQNDKPVIGIYGVNQEGSGDMYYKGANMIHTIRQVINNDSLFRDILRGLNHDFYHQTVTSAQVEAYISTKSGIDFSKVFDQYLRTTNIPVLEYRVEGGKITYRWTNCVPGFDLKIRYRVGNGEEHWMSPTTNWQEIPLPASATSENLVVDKNFYVNTKNTGR